MAYLDDNGLLYFWQKIKTYVTGQVPSKTSDLTNDSGYITINDVPPGSVASTTTPKMDGTASTGSENAFARGDHIHPTDTSRAPLASPAFTGTPTAPTATAGTNTTQIATTAFVKTAVDNKTVPSPSSASPEMDGTAAAGSSANYARGDHVHPTDTSRAAASHNHAAGDITSGELSVARGGTGKNTLTSGAALIGNGTSAVNLRSITNNTTATAPTTSTNLITMNTLKNAIGVSGGAASYSHSHSDATQSAAGYMSSADKTKLDAFGAASTYALKTDISGAYIYKGSVATENDLPSSGQTAGDVYNIVAASSYGAAGANVAWTGTAWDALGETFTITAITNAEIDTIVAS